MEILPANDKQNQFLHNIMMVFFTTGSWLIFALVALKQPSWPVYVALIMMLIFAHLFPALWFWDMYLRAFFYPESEMQKEDFFDLAFERWITKQGSKESNYLARLEARIRALEEEKQQELG